MNNAQLAKALARAIFKAGDHAPHDYAQRIAFKGGRYTVDLDQETNLGGFSEVALEQHIRTTLDDLNVVLSESASE